MTLEEGALVVAIAAAAFLELFFILKAYYEIRTAKLYERLVQDIRRLERD